VIKLLGVHHGGGVGGAPVSMLKLLAALDRSRFEALAVFTEPGPVTSHAAGLRVPSRVERTGGAFFYSAHARLEPRGVARFLRTFGPSVFRARAVLRAERPDVLHLNTSVLLAWAVAARRERVPVVWVVREVLGPNPVLRNWHAGFIVRHARRVVAISEAVRSCFPPTADVRVVHNAVDLADFPFVAAPEANVVALVGSPQRVKGHWLMLDVLECLPDVKLMLVAGGADSAYAMSARGRVKRAMGLPLDNLAAFQRDAAKRGLSERLHVTGFVAPQELGRMLAACDVLVFPSLEPEGFGRPIIEAMAMARPVVATDLGPSREILGPDAGRLVPPTSEAIARALRDLLERPEERRRLGMCGRARVEQCFTLDRQVDATSAIYADAVA
jgi:glycosyltransferase involved in cell wall biosynthesis